MDSASIVLAAVVQALKADEAVKDIVNDRVYSDVPQGAAYPHVVVELESEPFAADDFSGQTHAVRVHCYSRRGSKKPALDLRAACHAVLDRGEERIQLSTGTLIKSEYAGLSDCIPEDNGDVWDGFSEFTMQVV